MRVDPGTPRRRKANGIAFRLAGKIHTVSPELGIPGYDLQDRSVRSYGQVLAGFAWGVIADPVRFAFGSRGDAHSS